MPHGIKPKTKSTTIYIIKGDQVNLKRTTNCLSKKQEEKKTKTLGYEDPRVQSDQKDQKWPLFTIRTKQ